MTHLKSIIQISYSSCNIIKLLRGCYTPCRKEKKKVTKGENAETLQGLAGSYQKLKGVRVSRTPPAITASSAQQTSQSKLANSPLLFPDSRVPAGHSLCLPEKHRNARLSSLHHQNVLSVYYVLVLGRQRQDRVSPPEGALTIIGKTDKTA